jgi:hypothetical protein
MATNVRFLQKQNITLPVAASAVGLNTIAGLIIHVSLLVLFGLVASRIMLAAAHRSGMCVLGAVREPGMPILAIVSMDQKTRLASKAHGR